MQNNNFNLNKKGTKTMCKSIKVLVLLAFCFCIHFLLVVNVYAAEEAEQQIQTDLAVWTFSDTASDRLVADDGVLGGQMRLSAVGHRGRGTISSPIFGTGANAGQLLMSFWNAPHLSDKYWLIQSTSSIGSILAKYHVLEISFSSHSSNSGPRDFALEAYINGSWINVANYALANSTQNFTFQLPSEIKEDEHFQIRLRALNNTSVIGGGMTLAGESRISNIRLTGIVYHMEDIAQWQFKSLNLFNNNATTATGGSHLASTFGLAGGGNLSIGTGSTFGQLFVNGWGNANGLNSNRHWHINTQTIGYRNIQISFSAHGSNTGPRDFVVEVNTGNEWVPVAYYALTDTGQTFNFNLPGFTSNVPVLDIRLRPVNDTSINGSTVQTAGTSRIYDIAISGVPMASPNAHRYTQVVEQGVEYTVVLLAVDWQHATNSAFTLIYNPSIIEITNIQELTNLMPAANAPTGIGINIILHDDGVLVFAHNGIQPFAESELNLLRVVVTFTAKTDGIAALIFE